MTTPGAPARIPRLRGRALLLLAVGMVAAAALVFLGAPGQSAPDAAPGRSDGSSGEGAYPTPQDRAVAFGYLLDTPRPPEVVDESLVIAEKLRLRYGIDTGNREADRLAAARRAKEELLDALVFSPAELEEAARSLGYSLDPAECANFCENVARLADIELKKRALKAFAEGGAGPGLPRSTAATPRP